jgi:ABC-type transport system substrate-binding protein
MITRPGQQRCLAAATMIGLLLALGTSSNAQAAARAFIFALRRTEPVTTLDYLDVQFTESLMVEAQIMEGLVEFDPQNERLTVPRLAKSYRIDLYTYVFRLRNDVYFHPHSHGREAAATERVTPEDVVFSLQRAMSSAGAQQCKLDNVESIVVVGRDLIKVKLRKPDDDFLSCLATALGHVTCKKYYESLGPDEARRKRAFARAPIGSGPYRLAHPVRDGVPIVLLRFDSYWDKDWVKSRKAPERIEYRYSDSVQAVLHGLEAGEIGAATMMLSTLGEGGLLDTKKRRRFGAQYLLEPPFLSLLAINLTKPELADKAIRQLLNAAIDRGNIEQICPQSSSVIPEGYRYYLDITKRYLETKPPNVQMLLHSQPQAQERLRALKRHGPLILMVRAGEDLTRDRIVASITNDLERELQLEVRVLKPERFSAELLAPRPSYDLVYVDWSPDTPAEREGLSILYPLFYSQSRTNISHFSDPVVDNLFERIAGVVDKLAATKHYVEIQDLLIENPPHIWLPSVRSNILVYGKGYRSRVRPSSQVYYSSFLKWAELRK